MKRRHFLKLTGLSYIISFLPFKLFAEKRYKISDFLDNKVYDNENLYFFKETEFSKKIMDGLFKNGCLNEKFSFQYYLQIHNSFSYINLDYKEFYTKNELEEFVYSCIESSKNNGFAIHGDKVKYPFYLVKTENYETSKTVLTFNGYCCRKDGKKQYEL